MNLSVDILQVAQVTQSYVDWFSNKEVVRYSNNQYLNFSFEGQCSYVEDCLKNEDVKLYGIFDEKTHIGNIALNGLTSHHHRAELTYVIGETDYWGKGVASFAISKIIEIAKADLKLKRLYAGLANGNVGSRRALEKNGFVLEGIRKRHLFYSGEFFDQLDFGLTF